MSRPLSFRVSGPGAWGQILRHSVRQIRTSHRPRRGFSCAWGLVLCGLRGLGFRVWDPGFAANGLRFTRLRDKAGSADWGFHSFKQTFWMQVLKELAELLWGEVPCLSKSSVYFLALVLSCRASCQAPRCFRLIKLDVQGFELATTHNVLPISPSLPNSRNPKHKSPAP